MDEAYRHYNQPSNVRDPSSRRVSGEDDLVRIFEDNLHIHGRRMEYGMHRDQSQRCRMSGLGGSPDMGSGGMAPERFMGDMSPRNYGRSG
jgi:hypothetical protein